MSVALKNPRRIFSQVGGDASLPDRVAALENNTFKVQYYAEISSDSGTITVPTGATIQLNQFREGADALVSTIANDFPTGISPETSGGVEVDVSSFDADGDYTLSGTPSSTPVALIYILTITAADYGNLDPDFIISEDRDTDPIITRIASSATPTPIISTNIAVTDYLIITALATNPTIAAPTGTAYGGKMLIIRIKDNGTSRTLSFNAIYRFSTDLPAPTATTISKTFYLGFVYNSVDSKFDCLAQLNNL